MTDQSTKLSPADLDRLEKLEVKATVAPWSIDEDYREGMEWNNHIMSKPGHAVCFMANGGGDLSVQNELDAAAKLLCALRNHAPSLIAAAREVEGIRADAADAQHVLNCAVKEMRRIARENVALQSRLEAAEKQLTDASEIIRKHEQGGAVNAAFNKWLAAYDRSTKGLHP